MKQSLSNQSNIIYHFYAHFINVNYFPDYPELSRVRIHDN